VTRSEGGERRGGRSKGGEGRVCVARDDSAVSRFRSPLIYGAVWCCSGGGKSGGRDSVQNGRIVGGKGVVRCGGVTKGEEEMGERKWEGGRGGHLHCGIGTR